MTRKRALNDASRGYLLVEIEERCREAIIGGELLAEWVGAESDVSKIWFALRGVLNAGANISLLLGGREGPKTVERAGIRSFLGVTRHSPLHNSIIRHDSEHMDDRIQRAQNTPDSEPGMGYGYGPGRLPGLPFLHGYDTSTGVVLFNHREVSIPELLAEARRIAARISTVLKPDDIPGLER